MVNVIKIITENSDGSTTTWVPQSTVVTPTPNGPSKPSVSIPPTKPSTPRRTNIGMNLEPISYYMGERVFNDLSKIISPLLCKKVHTWDDGPQITSFDKNGWPTLIPDGCFLASVIDLKKGHSNAEYTFYSPNGVVTCDNQVSTGVFRKTTDEQRVLIRINKPISFWSFKESSNKSSSTFAQSFVDRNKTYSTLRFMDWSKTNIDREVNWQTRVQKDWYTQGGTETAVEYMIELCNVTDTSPWYCVHHRADDVFVRELAKLFKRELKNNKPVYLEHSNEVWNAAFPQYEFCRTRSPKTGAPLEYSLLRTARIAKIFKEEGVNVISVFGAQCAAWGQMEWLLKSVALPEPIDAFAIAPYFGYQITDNSKKDVNLILDEADKNIPVVFSAVSKWMELAKKHNKQLIGYEGGQHICPFPYEHGNQTVVNNFIEANRSPRMYDLYSKYLREWDKITENALLCLFNSSQPFSKWGSWGLQEYESQPASQAHKYRAVIDHMSKK